MGSKSDGEGWGPHPDRGGSVGSPWVTSPREVDGDPVAVEAHPSWVGALPVVVGRAFRRDLWASTRARGHLPRHRCASARRGDRIRGGSRGLGSRLKHLWEGADREAEARKGAKNRSATNRRC